MVVHAALGQAGGAAGVGQQRHVVGAHHVRGGRVAGRERVGPRHDLAVGQRGQRVARAEPVGPGRRGGVVAGHAGIEGVGELAHDEVRQALLGRQCVAGLGQLGREVAGGDRHLGVGVDDVVLELFGPVHRVDRHHDGVGAQDGEMRDHQLRAVLHVQHHAVAALHAQRMQRAGQPLDLVGHVAVAQHAAEEDQRGLVGVARRRGGQVVPQRGRGDGDRMREALGPELVMRAWLHGL
ncbi:hypothetical protein D3C72_1079530 [compost metagenome]